MGFSDDRRLEETTLGQRASASALILVVLALALIGTVSPAALAAGGQDEAHRVQVESYREDFDVSAQVAEKHLAIQDRGAGIVRQLEAEQGADYAGVWFDNETGEFVIPLLSTAKRSATEASLVHARLGGDFRIAQANFSWDELEAAHDRVDESLRPLIDAGLVQTSLDPRTNAVVIHEAAEAGAPAKASIRRAASIVPGAVEVREEAMERFVAGTGACNTYNPPGYTARTCDAPLRGGVFIEGPSSICSSGFKAIGNVNGNRFMLTAGHCTESVGTHWSSWDGKGNQRYIGEAEQSTWPMGDWGKIRVKSTSWWEEQVSYWPSQLVYWWPGGIHENIGVTYESSSYLGQSVCHSGTTTGTSCGTVTGLDKSVEYMLGRVTEASGASLCAWHGDSGGPVFSGGTALGLYSGQWEIPWCGGNAMFYVEITEATANLGVSVGTPAGAQPYAETAAATGVQAHQFTANGKVDPNGLPTEYKFAYGKTTEYGSWSQSWSAGSGWHPGAVSQVVPNLTPNTGYHYRIVATNTSGYHLGEDKQFSTPAVAPAVSTGSAQGFTDTEATLTGTVNPENSGIATYYAEYGLTTSYGSKTLESTVASGTSPVAVTRSVAGLKPDTVYHYRMVAKNAWGTTYGSDQVFRTLEQPPTFLYSIGAAGSSDGQFSAPFGITVDPQNNIWVADTGNDRVQKFNEKGEFLLKFGSAGTGNGQFESPMGIAADAQGNVWVVDNGNDRVQKFNEKGEFLLKFGSPGTGNGQFESPIGIATNSSGQLFVTDAGNSRVQKFSSSGGFLLKFGSAGSGNGQFEVPWDIATDSSGNVWVADYNRYRVQRFNSNGEYVAKFGSQGSGYGQFNLPTGLAADAKGHIWVTDTFNYRVQGFNVGGEMRALFGKFGSGSGQFNIPRDIVSDSQGNLWVVDENNDRIQKWVYTSQPKVTTKPATETKPASATLNALVNPQGLPTSYQFEYGKTTAYGSKAPATPKSVGTDTADVAVSLSLSGLEPETTYHFRVVATNSKGKTLGEDLTFTTPAVPLVFSYYFGKEGSGGGELNHPRELAFDPSGNLWVADTDNNRVQKFTPKGELLVQAGSFGTGNGQLDHPRDVAVDPEGNVWVVDTGNNRVQKFNSKGEFLLKFGTQGTGNGQFYTPRGVGIDPEGNIWVTDNSYVQKFTPGGEFLVKYGTLYQFMYPEDVAFDSKGTAFVLSSGRVKQLNSKGETVGEFGYPYLTFAEGFAIDANDNFWVSDAYDGVLHKFNAKGELVLQAGEMGSGLGQLQYPDGVAIDTEGHVWVADRFNNRITEWIYGGRPEGKAKVTTESATEVLGDSATLHGKVNPEGIATEYRFEYGKTTGYGSSVPIVPQAIGSGTTVVSTSQKPTGLSGETTYHYRLVAESKAGVNYGEDMTFTTLKYPKIVSQSATEVKTTSAILNASINPQGYATNYQIEYGKTTAYWAKVPVSPEPVGAGTTAVAVSEPIEGLEPQVTYHYRTVATSGVGTSVGPDRTFTTQAPGPSFGFAFGTSGSGPGQLNEPNDLAVDGAGNIVVVEGGNDRVQKFSEKGEYLSQFGSTGTGNGQFSSPGSLAIDSEGNIWVVDTGNDRVQKFNSSGGFVLKFGSEGSGEGQFFNPQATDVDPEGNVSVVDAFRVQRFSPEGEFLLKFGSGGNGNGQLLFPRGLAIDSGGHTWVADTSNNRVQRFGPGGGFETAFGSKGSGAGQFTTPVGIAIDASGNIWIVDQGNNRIQKWS